MLGRLYVILDSGYLNERDFPIVARKVLKGGADILQIRAKGWSEGTLRKVSDEVYRITRDYNVPLIINDFPTVGRLYDGVHIGAEDLPYEKTRQIVGDGKIVGVSVYESLKLALAMERAGADYVAFSSPYPSPTKPQKSLASFKLIERASYTLKIPFYVIGGINEDRARKVVLKGAYGVAVIGAVLSAPDPEEATRRLKDAVYSCI
ncbi:MAG: thiamine phosphate synthase [Thermotogae bacterium]|nr:thiamine phosphate synthase [Thermotogota bacterium]